MPARRPKRLRRRCRLASAQALSGTIVGTITDASGAAVTDATVTLTNTGTGFTRAVSTNASGQYVAPTIPTGTYTVAVEKPGSQSSWWLRMTRRAFTIHA